MKNQFILEKKKEYSFAFNVPEKNIIISNLIQVQLIIHWV